MSTYVPNNNNLRLTMLVTEEELAAVGKERLLYSCYQKLGSGILTHLAEKCCTISPNHDTWCVSLEVDAIVLGRQELLDMLASARRDGRNDYARFGGKL